MSLEQRVAELERRRTTGSYIRADRSRQVSEARRSITDWVALTGRWCMARIEVKATPNSVDDALPVCVGRQPCVPGCRKLSFHPTQTVQSQALRPVVVLRSLCGDLEQALHVLGLQVLPVAVHPSSQIRLEDRSRQVREHVCR